MKKIIIMLLILLLTGCSVSFNDFQEEKQNQIDNCINNNGQAIIKYYNDGNIQSVECILKK